MLATTNTKDETARKHIKSVTILTIASNIALFILKITFGLLVQSIALIADAIHSLSDLLTDLGVLLGMHLSSKEPDQSHPYGHGRAETFAAIFISLILAVVGASMIYYAALDIARTKFTKPNVSILVVAIISILTKEALYRITRSVAVKFHSAALYANAWHHRSDALSSIAVAMGFIASEFGFNYGDQIAAVAVGLMVIFVAAKVLGDCISELTERSVDTETLEKITSIINSDARIHGWHKLRTRTIAREIFLDLHILVDPTLDITSAHQIAEDLENTLHTQLNQPVNITVHLEPDIPELRK